MAHYRRLPLRKLYNCRDLGGYPTADGKVTRFGVPLKKCLLEKFLWEGCMVLTASVRMI